MSYDVTVLAVIIASPGDVAQERLAAQRIVYEWVFQTTAIVVHRLG